MGRPVQETTCPTCGSRVRVHSSDEGTCSYVPVQVQEDAVQEALRYARDFCAKLSPRARHTSDRHILALAARLSALEDALKRLAGHSTVRIADALDMRDIARAVLAGVSATPEGETE